ncbi:MAG TPA: GAF domain-containing sensor histidine kinase, partial [Candidatus Methylomirabilis sp.]
ELVTQVVSLIRDTFGHYHANLFLVDEASNEIVLRECSGHADESLRARGLRLKIGEEGITGWVASSGQPVLCNDVSHEPRYSPHELLPDTRSELAVPLRVGGRVVGVLDVQSAQRDAFQTDDLTVLQILADQVAIAIQNARLFQETQRQVELLRVLHDISLTLTSQLESEKVPAVILEHATRLLRAQGSSLSIYDPQTDLIRVIAIYHGPPEYQGVALRSGDGVVGRVVATGKPLIVNDYRTWSGRSDRVSHLDQTYEAVLSVPLRWQGQAFGALLTFDRPERRRFTQEDIQPLSLFADLAAIALKNAELYSQVRQFNEGLEQQVEERTRELEQAREALAEKANQLQRLLATTIGIQEEERARIAKDLHDESNQLITGALYEIQAAQEGVRRQHGEIALAKLETAKSLMRKMDDVNRWIISGLRPPILDAQGLVQALKSHGDAYQKSYRIPCVVQVSGHPDRMAPEVETAIYRIVQESLNNVAAHARAQSVHIRVEFRASRLRVVVEDDGVGFDHESALTAASGQMGLIGMRERAQSIGGRIEMRSAPGQGTRLVLEVPLPIESAPDVVSA